MKRFNRPTFFLGCILVVIACFFLYLSGHKKFAIINALDKQSMDIMYKIRGTQPQSKAVLIVDLDENSLKQIGQWPWPRNILEKMTRHLLDSGVRAIGFDIVFPEKDRASPVHFFRNLPPALKAYLPADLLSQLSGHPIFDYDGAFGQALSEGPTVLGYAFESQNDGLKNQADLPFPSAHIHVQPDTLKFKDLSLIQNYRAIVNHPDVAMSESEGFINVFADDSGTTRQVPLIMMMDDIPYPSLALEVFRVGRKIPAITIHASRRIQGPRRPILGIQLADRFIPTDSHAQMFINYRGPRHTFDYISAVDVLNRTGLERFKDKYVLIGTSSIGLFDLKTTPFSNAVPGVEINATIIDNLIQSDPFVYDRLTEIGLNYTMIVLGGLIITLMLTSLGPLAGGLGAVGFLTASCVLNYACFFARHHYVGISYPLISCFIILLILSVFNAFSEGRNKRFIQKAFSRYVSPDVVTQLIKNPTALSLAGEEKELTVLFCDIRGFTTLSEKMDSKDLGHFMNQFLTHMSQIILANQGTVDKFIGDAIMAFWGAPNPVPDHARLAVHTALEMKNKLDDFLLEHKNSPRISVGIGINTGMMSVGNFGSRQRFDYTVMGDHVNLASRLEGANKNYGTCILISESTKNIIKDDVYFRFVDKVQVKGRHAPVNLFEPLFEGPPPAHIAEEVDLFEKGVAAYQHQQFKQALTIFTSLLNQFPCRLYESYIDRINGFIASPPPDGWSGTERRERLPATKLTTK
jgi:adenylate cyclase